VGRSASGAESPLRSIAKALIWRAFAFCQTMIVSIIFLKEVSTGASALVFRFAFLPIV
jgi:hypothetical protein